MLTDSLKNKVALVTGAGRGIGKEIAKTLASCGAFVIVNYNSSPEAAEQTVKEIIKQGGMAAPVQCDVSDFDACGKMMEMIINNYGHLDILVNNAGITRDGLIMKMSEEDFDRVLDTNLKGAFHTIRHASRYFLKQKSGKIINISSVSGVMGNAGQANYSASKAGVIGLTKSAARELASRGITVNAVAPGFIETDMTLKLKEVNDGAAWESMMQRIPMGYAGKAADVGNMVAFLASDEASYITSEVINVGGGMIV